MKISVQIALSGDHSPFVLFFFFCLANFAISLVWRPRHFLYFCLAIRRHYYTFWVEAVWRSTPFYALLA